MTIVVAGNTMAAGATARIRALEAERDQLAKALDAAHEVIAQLRAALAEAKGTRDA